MSTANRITVQRQFDHARIVLNGDFDVPQNDELMELSLNLFTQLTATVEVDLHGVTFLGSRAITALLHLRNEVDRHSGAELRIVRCNPRVMQVLEYAGVVEWLAIGGSTLDQSMPDVA